MTKKVKIGSSIIFILFALFAFGFFGWMAIINFNVLFRGSNTDKPANQTTASATGQQIDQIIDQTTDQTFASSTDQTTTPATGQSTGQPTEQTADQTTATTTDSQSNVTKPLLWGAYVGWQLPQLDEFEQKVGKQVNHQAVFVHWGNENEFPLDLATGLKNKNKTLIIFWEATDYNIESPEQPKFSYDRILAGDWDSYLKSFAQAAKSYGGEVILIPFEEMNGDWYPWALTKNKNSAAKHIAAYRYLHSFFTEAANVKFGWSVNADSVPDTAANDWLKAYPGDEYVDYVGVNGFNFGQPWQTFTEIFATALNRLKNINKHIYIFSFACADSPKKPGWIREALTTEIYQYPEIVGWNWFNENKEADWRVWSSTLSLEAFKQAIK